MCQRALTRKRTLGVQEAGGLLQRLQRGVALQALGESSSSLGTEFVETQTASMGAEAGAEACQWALTQKANYSRGGGALERSHSAPLEPLAQLRDTLSSVGAIAAVIEAAELVVGQTAKGRR